VSAGGGRELIPTGVAVAIPPGYAGFVLPRSGLALRHGVTCLNAPGLIDSGYRGEIQVILVNHDPVDAYTVRRGDRMAQLVVMAVEAVAFDLVGEDGLGPAARGAGGFGHTGT
jgi:dUTP pyrophosphatase